MSERIYVSDKVREFRTHKVPSENHFLPILCGSGEIGKESVSFGTRSICKCLGRRAQGIPAAVGHLYNRAMDCSGKKIVVIGGGIAGLSAAWKLRTLVPSANVIVVEASDRAGGILQTHSASGYLIDQAADMFTTEPDDALSLCRALGHEADLLTTTPVDQRAWIATEQSIEPVPRGFSLMLPADLDAIQTTNILDDGGIKRLLDEVNVPPSSDHADEDFQSFVVRRFGQQAFERLVQPLVSGIYTADPRRLSMNATMRRFVDMERTHGSLIKAAFASQASSADRSASGARYDLFRTPRDGMSSLVHWLLDSMDGVDVRFKWPVSTIEPQPNQGWAIHSSQPALERLKADAVVIASPVSRAAEMLASVSQTLSRDLIAIRSASCAVVTMGFDRSQFRRTFDGYGIVVPAILGRRLIAASFASNKFPGRAPENKMLVRCFIGGAMQGELVDLSDRQLVDLAMNELSKLVGLDGLPEVDFVFRWRNAMPQYHVGHLDRVDSIEKTLDRFPTLTLAGNAYRGVGIPICIRSGIAAATRIASACSS